MTSKKVVRKLTHTQKYVILRLPREWIPHGAHWAAIELRDGKLIVTILE